MCAAPYRPILLVFDRLSGAEQQTRLSDFHARMVTRRTVRDYSDEPVSDEIIDRAIAVAGSAPSGANQQPWRFVVVRDREIKRRIREAAEQEEREFYERRAPREWLDALAPLVDEIRIVR